METKEQKAARHARKEEKLRKQLKGNSTIRTMWIERVCDKKKWDENDIKDIERLLAFPENIVNCKFSYQRLVNKIKVENFPELQKKAECFWNETQKLHLPKN